MKKNIKQKPPTVAMRLSDADKFALCKVAAQMGKSQTETVRVLVRERLAIYLLATLPKTARVKR